MSNFLVLDEDGQPINRFIGAPRLADRSIDEFIGMCKGMTADGIVNTDEINFLCRWFEANAGYMNTWPADILADRITKMLSDGVVDEGEKEDVFCVLNEIAGSTKIYYDTIKNNSTTLPLCRPAPDITFRDKLFCLTGKFYYGTRSRCQEEIISRGGQLQSNPTQKTNYLIIGNIGSSDWIHTSFGRKIEAAVEIKNKGVSLSIVSEEHWVNFL